MDIYIGDLRQNNPYLITKLGEAETKYGRNITVKLENGSFTTNVYLPKSISMTSEQIYE